MEGARGGRGTLDAAAAGAASEVEQRNAASSELLVWQHLLAEADAAMPPIRGTAKQQLPATASTSAALWDDSRGAGADQGRSGIFGAEGLGGLRIPGRAPPTARPAGSRPLIQEVEPSASSSAEDSKEGSGGEEGEEQEEEGEEEEEEDSQPLAHPTARTRDILRKARGLPAHERENMAEGARMRGNEAFRSDNLFDALDMYTLAMELNPTDARLPANRAAAFIRLHRWGEALTDADAALALEPENIKALLRRAKALQHLNREGEALQTLDRIEQMQPGAPDAQHMRSSLQRALASARNGGAPASAATSAPRRSTAFMEAVATRRRGPAAAATATADAAAAGGREKGSGREAGNEQQTGQQQRQQQQQQQREEEEGAQGEEASAGVQQQGASNVVVIPVVAGTVEDSSEEEEEEETEQQTPTPEAAAVAAAAAQAAEPPAAAAEPLAAAAADSVTAVPPVEAAASREDSLNIRGRELFQAGDTAGAIALWQEVLMEEPNHLGALLNLSLAMLDRDPSQAEQAAAEVLALPEGRATSGQVIKAHHRRALALEKLGRVEEALAHIIKISHLGQVGEDMYRISNAVKEQAKARRPWEQGAAAADGDDGSEGMKEGSCVVEVVEVQQQDLSVPAVQQQQGKEDKEQQQQAQPKQEGEEEAQLAPQLQTEAEEQEQEPKPPVEAAVVEAAGSADSPGRPEQTAPAVAAGADAAQQQADCVEPPEPAAVESCNEPVAIAAAAGQPSPGVPQAAAPQDPAIPEDEPFTPPRPARVKHAITVVPDSSDDLEEDQEASAAAGPAAASEAASGDAPTGAAGTVAAGAVAAGEKQQGSRRSVILVVEEDSSSGDETEGGAAEAQEPAVLQAAEANAAPCAEEADSAAALVEAGAVAAAEAAIGTNAAVDEEGQQHAAPAASNAAESLGPEQQQEEGEQQQQEAEAAGHQAPAGKKKKKSKKKAKAAGGEAAAATDPAAAASANAAEEPAPASSSAPPPPPLPPPPETDEPHTTVTMELQGIAQPVVLRVPTAALATAQAIQQVCRKRMEQEMLAGLSARRSGSGSHSFEEEMEDRDAMMGRIAAVKRRGERRRDEAGAHMTRAAVMLREGKATEALRVLSQAADLDPSDHRPAALMSEAYLKIKRPDKALDTANAALALGLVAEAPDPSDPYSASSRRDDPWAAPRPGRQGLASLLATRTAALRAGWRLKEALEASKQAVLLNPANASYVQLVLDTRADYKRQVEAVVVAQRRAEAAAATAAAAAAAVAASDLDAAFEATAQGGPPGSKAAAAVKAAEAVVGGEANAGPAAVDAAAGAGGVAWRVNRIVVEEVSDSGSDSSRGGEGEVVSCL